jgi:hypothetical protein
MNKKVLATMPEKENPKKKVKVTLVQPKEVLSDNNIKKLSGQTYEKLDGIAYAKFVQMAIDQGKNFGHADFGPIVELDVDDITQHPLNHKWFGLGEDNFEPLMEDIGNRPAQQAIGVIQVAPNVFHCIDGSRRLSSYKRHNFEKIEARIARREMTEKEIEYHIIMANVSVRNFKLAQKIEIAICFWPKLKKRIEEQLFVSRHGGNPKHVQGIPTSKEMAKKMNITEKEADAIKARLSKQIQVEKRRKLISYGDKPNEITLKKFYMGIANTIDRTLSGENAATVQVAQKYLFKKSKNLFAK